MAISIDAAASKLMPRYGNSAFDCGGALIRAQRRQLATVVTIRGTVNATNIDRVSAYSRRFVLADMPFILDLSDVESFDVPAVSLLHRIDEDCRRAGEEWALVPSDAVERVLDLEHDAAFPVARSASEALRYFAEAISMRRRMLLPLLTKSA